MEALKIIEENWSLTYKLCVYVKKGIVYTTEGMVLDNIDICLKPDGTGNYFRVKNPVSEHLAVQLTATETNIRQLKPVPQPNNPANELLLGYPTVRTYFTVTRSGTNYILRSNFTTFAIPSGKLDEFSIKLLRRLEDGLKQIVDTKVIINAQLPMPIAEEILEYL